MESPNSNYKNLASILLINAGNSSDTTIVVDDTDAAIMPTAPFYATIMPTTELANITNSEIVYVTASSSSGGETTYTVSRGQRGTTAQSWDAGKAVMTQAVYTQDVQAQKQGYYNAALSSGSAFTITNASAPTTPVVGSRISVIFDTNITTASTVTLAINGGTAYNVAVSSVTFDSVGTLTTSITIASGKLYDIIFDGTEWVIANTFGKVTSDNIDWATIKYFVPSGQELLLGQDWNGNDVYRKLIEGNVTINANQRFSISMEGVARVYDLKGFISDYTQFNADILINSAYIGGSGSVTFQSGALVERNNSVLRIYGMSSVALGNCAYKVVVDYVKSTS